MNNVNTPLLKRSAPVETDETALKKVCLSPEDKQQTKSKSDRSSFNGTTIVDILQDNRSHKTLFLHGKFDENVEDDAVIILEKRPFDLKSNSLKKVFSSATTLKTDLQNDIYTTFSAQLPSDLNDVKATVIYPATKKHIEKYKSQKLVIVNETADDYMAITKPFLEKQFENQSFSLQWVYNILEHKKESDRIIFEDLDPEVGFILLPDMKWNVEDLASLYCIALPLKRGIKSLRDLTKEHIPLLRNVKQKAVDTIATKFGVAKDSLRLYLHYQPSYYHLHVHINSVSLDVPGTGVLRAHLLSDVIENLQLCSDYYKNKTISFLLKENDRLLHELYLQKSK